MTIFPASGPASGFSRSPWPSQGTATITTSAAAAASAFAMPRMPRSAPISSAAATARSTLREPMMTWFPASANLRARPRPWSPVPPRMPIARAVTSGPGAGCCCDMARSCQSGGGPWHHGGVNAEQVAALRVLLAPTGWLDRAAEFARALRGSARTPGGLLLVGTPEDEPWHFAAHLDDESRLAGLPELAPTLIRWNPPPGAPAHLSVGMA